MRARLAALVAAVALALTGCTGLSADDTVRGGLPIEPGDAPVIDYVPPGPNPGAEPASIIRGFVRAGAASDGTYDVARQYLTAEAAKTWSPDQTVVVLAGSAPLDVRRLSPLRYRLTGEVASVIDDGRSEPVAAGGRRSAVIEVIQVDGEWRIATLPEGMGRWVSSVDFGRLFTTESVHYLSRTEASLVPDDRWFPRDHLVTRLAEAQLGAVPSYLAGVATTQAPAGAKLGSPGVALLDGTAIVDISSAEIASDTAARRRLWAQFATTLTRLPGVSRVLLQHEGVTVDFSGRPDGGLTPEDLGLAVTPLTLTTYPVLRSGAEVTQYAGERVKDLFGVGADSPKRRTYPPVPARFHELALSSDGAETAAVLLDGTGVSRWRGDVEYEVRVGAERIGRPTYDSLGYLWFGGVGSADGTPTRLWWVDKAADPADTEAARARRVDAPWLEDRVVLVAKLSPEADRIVVASTNEAGGDPQLHLAGVVRDRSGSPQALASPVRLAETLRRLVDVAWLDPITVGIVGGLKDEARPWIVATSGALRPLDEVSDVVAMTTLGGERDVVVVTAEGEVQIRAGSQWITFASGSDFVVAGG